MSRKRCKIKWWRLLGLLLLLVSSVFSVTAIYAAYSFFVGRCFMMLMECKNAVVIDENGAVVGKNIPFERVRRITGYLVGDKSRFNNAKKSEVRDRVTHK